MHTHYYLTHGVGKGNQLSNSTFPVEDAKDGYLSLEYDSGHGKAFLEAEMENFYSEGCSFQMKKNLERETKRYWTTAAMRDKHFITQKKKGQ